MKEVVWAPAAWAELGTAFTYIAQNNPEAAKRVRARIETLAADLAFVPERGKPGRAPNTREVVIPGLPYTLVYEEAPGFIYILRLWHQRQRRKGRRPTID